VRATPENVFFHTLPPFRLPPSYELDLEEPRKAEEGDPDCDEDDCPTQTCMPSILSQLTTWNLQEVEGCPMAPGLQDKPPAISASFSSATTRTSSSSTSSIQRNQAPVQSVMMDGPLKPASNCRDPSVKTYKSLFSGSITEKRVEKAPPSRPTFPFSFPHPDFSYRPAVLPARMLPPPSSSVLGAASSAISSVTYHSRVTIVSKAEVASSVSSSNTTSPCVEPEPEPEADLADWACWKLGAACVEGVTRWVECVSVRSALEFGLILCFPVCSSLVWRWLVVLHFPFLAPINETYFPLLA